MKIKLLLVIILVLIFSKLMAVNDTIAIHNNMYQVDSTKKLILVNQNVDSLNLETNTIYQAIKLNGVFTFISPVAEIEVGKQYIVHNELNEAHLLYFSQLPIIHIETENIVEDEPRVLANFFMVENNRDSIRSKIGIEFRGGWTQSLPKKSFRFEFWEDTDGNNTKNISLLNMRNDDDWNLQAMYNEPLRIRSKTSFHLWQLINKLHYSTSEPEAINSVRQKYVELFFNGEYRGIYALSERIDRKQLKLSKSEDNVLSGELYKGVSWGASTFKECPYFDNNNRYWSGFDYEYPDDFTNWETLYEFVNFVVNEDSLGFYSEYPNKFDIENAVDYFIFLNLVRATDNYGKNIYLAKYTKDDVYFYVPWDLDGTFGTIWNGTRENITNDILLNGFYKRLIWDNRSGGFTELLTNRWNKLREGLLTEDSLLNLLNENYNYLLENGVYERELIAWPENNFIDFDNLAYTKIWLNERLAYLDKVFNDMDLLTGIQNIEKYAEFSIYPNPASSFIQINNLNEPLYIEIRNILGQLIYRENILFDTRIDLSDMKEGTYFISGFLAMEARRQKNSL